MFGNKTIRFMKQRKVAAIFSAVLLLGAIGSLIVNQLQFGLDFTGGTQLEVGFEQPVALAQVRTSLDEQLLTNTSVVHFGSDVDVLIRMQGSIKDIGVQQIERSLQNIGSEITVELGSKSITSDQYAERLLIHGGAATLKDDLAKIFPAVKYGKIQAEIEDGNNNDGSNSLVVFLETGIDEVVTKDLIDSLTQTTGQTATLRRSEFVGPQVGEELRDDGGLGLLFALAVVMVYIALRFQFKFSVGAVVALTHDVLIVLGIFSAVKLDFDLTVLAAVLAVIGYSLNDTIVVSDRIRENFRKIRKSTSSDIIDISLTQTLGRTVVTSFTTLLVLLALFFVGGELNHGFATALIIGVFVGTYSSIYVVPNVLLVMNISKEDLVIPEKEGVELDDMV